MSYAQKKKKTLSILGEFTIRMHQVIIRHKAGRLYSVLSNAYTKLYTEADSNYQYASRFPSASNGSHSHHSDLAVYLRIC